MAYLKRNSPVPEKGKGSKLTFKQLRFVEEYMLDMNSKEAVVRAGYKTKNPLHIGTELLQHPLVKQEIDERMADRKERMELTSDYVITKLVDIVEATQKGNPQAALRGLELLGKHLGLYRDRQEISGPDGGAIEMEQKVKENAADFTSAIARLAERNREEQVAIDSDGSRKSGT